MKRVFKFIFSFIISFVFISSVSALEVKYEWGKEFEDYYRLYNVFQDNNEFILTGYDSDWNDFYDLVDEDFEYVDTLDGSRMCYLYYPEVEIENERYYVALYNNNGSGSSKDAKSSNTYYYIVTLLNDNCEEEILLDIQTNGSFYYAYLNEIDDFYVMIDEYLEKILVVNKDFDSYEYFDIEELDDSDLKELLGDYYYPYKKMSSISNLEYFEVTLDNDVAFIQYFTYSSSPSYYVMTIDLNNGNSNKLKLNKEGILSGYAKLYEGKVYFVREVNSDDIDTNCLLDSDEVTDDNEPNYCLTNFELVIYDLEFNELYVKQLQSVDGDYYDYIQGVGRYVGDIFVTDDSLYVVFNYNPGRKTNVPDYEVELPGENPIVVKYSIDYAIESKDDGNGKVEVNTNAKAGDKVTFKVTPNEGFVVNTIKITNMNGNVIEHSDNSFIMPSGDVIVDVTFKKEVINPNTISMGIVGLIVVSLIGVFILYKNGKKLSWLK